MQSCPFCRYTTSSTSTLGRYRAKCRYAKMAQKLQSSSPNVYYALSTVYQPSSQNVIDDFMDSNNMFLPSDSSLSPKPTYATPCPSSPVDVVIEDLAAFLDVLSRKTCVRMKSPLITFFHKTDFDTTGFSAN